MSVHSPARVRPGTPTGGQFSTAERPEPRLRLAPHPHTLPTHDELEPVELTSGRGLEAGWGLADTRTGEVVFGNDRRRGRYESEEAAAEWARERYPFIRAIAAKTHTKIVDPPSEPCPSCGAPLIQDLDDTDPTRVLTACDSCGHSQPTLTARR